MLRKYRLLCCRKNRHRCVTTLPEGLATWDDGRGGKMVSATNAETGITDRAFNAYDIFGRMNCPDCGRSLYTYRGGHSGKEFSGTIIAATGEHKPYDHPPIPAA